MKRFQAHDYRLDEEPVNWPLIVVELIVLVALLVEVAVAVTVFGGGA